MKFTVIGDDGRPFEVDGYQSDFEMLTSAGRTLPRGWQHVVVLDKDGRVPNTLRGSSSVSIRRGSP